MGRRVQSAEAKHGQSGQFSGAKGLSIAALYGVVSSEIAMRLGNFAVARFEAERAADLCDQFEEGLQGPGARTALKTAGGH